MSLFITWIVLALLTLAIVVIVTLAMAKPMRTLLSANSYISPAKNFYIRAFVVTCCLGALAFIAEHDIPDPCQANSMSAMQCVWWVAGSLQSSLWIMALFLASYIVMLTLLFAVLGRYRDE